MVSDSHAWCILTCCTLFFSQTPRGHFVSCNSSPFRWTYLLDQNWLISKASHWLKFLQVTGTIFRSFRPGLTIFSLQHIPKQVMLLKGFIVDKKCVLKKNCMDHFAFLCIFFYYSGLFRNNMGLLHAWSAVFCQERPTASDTAANLWKGAVFGAECSIHGFRLTTTNL